MMKKYLRKGLVGFVAFGSAILLFSGVVAARENVYNWYIKNLEVTYQVGKDARMQVVEKIAADCGNCVGKHGIFRIVPTERVTPTAVIPTPVQLISITDAAGKPRQYAENADSTVTWKIGDPDVEVSGVNDYWITYLVKNVIDGRNADFDEFYWNIHGAFWDLEVDQFQSLVTFPEGFDGQKAELNWYVGARGSKGGDGIDWAWVSPRELSVKYNGTLQANEGMTLSLTYPKGFFQIPELTWWEKNGRLVEPIVILSFALISAILLFYFWWVKGKEINLKKAIMPEYEPPKGSGFLENLAVEQVGIWKNQMVPATLVYLASQGLLTLEEKAGGFLGWGKDYIIKRVDKPESEAKLSELDKYFYQSFFDTFGPEEVLVSELKGKFMTFLRALQEQISATLYKNQHLEEQGKKYKTIYAVTGAIMVFGAFFMFEVSSYGWLWTTFLIVIGLLAIVLANFMERRSLKGANLAYNMLNYKEFLVTAEKHRAVFWEKENIFEIGLPYAVWWGVTGKWVAAMKNIYGDKFDAMSPIWYSAIASSGFNADSFSSAMSTMSSSISSSVGTDSGSGGGGSSGGGGGGGGGGGW